MFLPVQAGQIGPSGASAQSHVQVVAVPVHDTVKMEQTVLVINSSQKSVKRLHVHHGLHGSSGLAAV